MISTSIIDDKQYSDDAMISINIDGFSKPIFYMASEELDQNDKDFLKGNGYDDIMLIVDAAHQAYVESLKQF